MSTSKVSTSNVKTRAGTRTVVRPHNLTPVQIRAFRPGAAPKRDQVSVVAPLARPVQLEAPGSRPQQPAHPYLRPFQVAVSVDTVSAPILPVYLSCRASRPNSVVSGGHPPTSVWHLTDRGLTVLVVAFMCVMVVGAVAVVSALITFGSVGAGVPVVG